MSEINDEEKGLKDDTRLSLLMRAERHGDAAKTCLRELIRCQGLYSHWSIYDKAPEVAQQIFAGLPQDPNVLNKRFYSLFQNGSSDFSPRELAAANFYGMIEAFLNRGLHDRARFIIRKIIVNENPIKELSDYLHPLNVSFVELCVERGQLLVPKVLDSVVLQLFGPKSQEDYLDKPGIAIVHPSSNGYPVTIIRDKCIGQKAVMQDKIAFNNLILIRPEQHVIQGSEASLIGKIGELLALSPDKYCIIRSEHKELGSYISKRYIACRVGKMITDATTLRSQVDQSAEYI